MTVAAYCEDLLKRFPHDAQVVVGGYTEDEIVVAQGAKAEQVNDYTMKQLGIRGRSTAVSGSISVCLLR